MLLTIDLDIIMEPCINLYNSYINDGFNRQNLWEHIEKEINISSHLSINNQLWELIKNIIKIASEDNNINFIGFSDNHGSIIYTLEYIYNHYQEKIGQDKIINIDHHHDLGYNPVLKNKNLYLNCANWAKYLMDNYTKKYYWLHNLNSKMPNIDELDLIKFNENIFSADIDLYSLLKGCRAIFFTSSSNWIPIQYNSYIINLQSLLCYYFSNKHLFFFDNIPNINLQQLNLFKKDII